MRMRLHPFSSASRMSSPTPREVVCIGFRFSGGTSGRPHADATSRMAVGPDASSTMAYSASTGSLSGPVTVARTVRASSAAASTLTVPSPPSASGISTTSRGSSPLPAPCKPAAIDTASRTPTAIALATSSAPRHSLNESGATTIFITAVAGCGRPCREGGTGGRRDRSCCSGKG